MANLVTRGLGANGVVVTSGLGFNSFLGVVAAAAVGYVKMGVRKLGVRVRMGV
jgi:hypothetical protein